MKSLAAVGEFPFIEAIRRLAEHPPRDAAKAKLAAMPDTTSCSVSATTRRACACVAMPW